MLKGWPAILAALGAGVAALTLGAGAAWSIPGDADPDPGPTRVAKAVASLAGGAVPAQRPASARTALESAPVRSRKAPRSAAAGAVASPPVAATAISRPSVIAAAANIASVGVPVSPAAAVPQAGDYVLIRRTDLMAKPTSGPGWQFLKKQADSAWGTPNLSTLNSSTQTAVLAAGLVYARTGDSAYRDKVVAAVKKVPGTETAATVVLPFARNLFGYVVAADLVKMPLDTVCANGQTWRGFLEAARTKPFPGNTRWINLEVTSADSASNWNAYALSTHLAISLVLADAAAVQRDIDIYRRFLGDTTSPAKAFAPTAGYTWNNNGRTWDLTPTLQRGINPVKAGDPRSGAIILDALRHSTLTSVPCCKVDLAGRGYIEESLDGLLAIAMMLRAQGSDFAGFQDQALRRAYEFLVRNGGPSGYSNGRYLALAMNNWYGTAFDTSAGDSVARHLGFGGWLFTR